MRVERGPYGQIVVSSVDTHMFVVQHTLEILQNNTIPAILPVYIRQQWDRTEICIDCTGRTSLSSFNFCPWKDVQRQKEIIADFILTMLEAQDHFLSPTGFVIDDEYIFVDIEKEKLFWCYLPLRRDNSIGANTSVSAEKITSITSLDFPLDKLELLLMDNFFSSAIREEDRNQIICLFRDHRENDLRLFLEEFKAKPELDSPQNQNTVQWKHLLTLEFVIILAVYLLCFIASKKIASFPTAQILMKYFLLLLFLVILFNWIIYRKNSRTQTASNPPRKAQQESSITKKDMYFPKLKSKDNYNEGQSTIPTFATVFLIQKNTETTKKKLIKAAICRDDFLMGRDQFLCDLFLDHPSISDRHARILHRDTLYFLVDLGSTNGTFIGNRRLYSYEETPLCHEDTIRIGEIYFIFHHTAS